MKKEAYNELFTELGENLPVIPWNEYPRPQLVRNSFFCLNGEWEFTDSMGEEYTVIVPFAPESLLSGVNKRMGEKPAVIYRRSFSLPEGFLKDRVILHFGAVDQIAEVSINGKYLGRHEGGYQHFSFDITDFLNEKNELCVKVSNADDPLSLPYGKQCEKRGGMWYTPVTGIWQTVWIESVSSEYVRALDVSVNGALVTVTAQGVTEGKITLDDNGRAVETCLVDGVAALTLDSPRKWSCDDPYLYRFTLETEADSVSSYFAVRTVAIEKINGRAVITLNGKPIFLHGVLDQGYFSDGIFTPASPEEYKRDILSMKKLGFNMLRKHIKIEPDIFYYYCDLYGMTVMQDMVNNGDYSFIRDTALPTVGFKKRNDERLHTDPVTRDAFLRGMKETVEALRGFPSIIAWTVFNEGWGQFCGSEAYRFMKTLDDTRVIDTASGWFSSVDSDVESLHVYFKPVKIKKASEKPIFLSEFGGYSYRVDGHSFNTDGEYGYKSFKTSDELQNALDSLYLGEIVSAIKNGLCGTVYTQVSDVEDEINGLLTYDRRVLKVDAERMQNIARALFSAFDTQNG
ncbi:MAG: glycoside hydrolase family 2 [Clostridia bacterium]|nr:glycoside hydrolase family 2 [Clostridia bacterium]